jgi:hypothetical protein
MGRDPGEIIRDCSTPADRAASPWLTFIKYKNRGPINNDAHYRDSDSAGNKQQSLVQQS